MLLAVLHGIACENYGIRPLDVDIRNTSPQAVSPQLSSGLIRLGRQYVRIAYLGNNH